MQEISKLVETSIYVDDLIKAKEFYVRILGLRLMGEQENRHIFFQIGESMLLIFNATETRNSEHIPAHGAVGSGHFALGIAAENYGEWKRLLAGHNIEIEKEIVWPLGGKSIYFRDPSGNSVELITKGCWGLPSGW